MDYSDMHKTVNGKVVAGHGVASGRAGDPRFPDGTLGLQWPYFEELGLDLDGIFRGTVNVSVKPLTPRPINAMHTFRKVKWHPDCPAEDFSFFAIQIRVGVSDFKDGYIYWPHPETKPEHFQDPHVVEILAPRLEGVEVGMSAQLSYDAECLAFE